MSNRIHPGIPPSQRPERRPGTREASPLDAVALVSRPLQEVLRQQRAVGHLGDTGAFYDLMLVYRAAKLDPHLTPRPVMTPLEFTADFDHMVKALEDGDPERCMVDSGAAFAYAQQVDARVQIAVGDVLMKDTEAAVRSDPIQAGIDACKGGPFGLMFTAMAAVTATGQAPEDYFAALLDRAREQARDLDDIAAESLVDRVRKAIEGCPDLRTISARPEDIPDA